MSSSRGDAYTDGGTLDDEISYDDCFDLLSNHRRRYTLQYLEHNGGTATLGELSDQIAAWENAIDIDEVSYDERKRVYTSLQQVHLPRMDDMAVVEFDDREGTVAIGPLADELDIYLEVVEGRQIPWEILYLGLVGINLVVIVLAWAGVPPISALNGVGLAVVVVTTFLLTALCHIYLARSEIQLGTHGVPPEVEH